uniref:Uncharacterized protein n=1 Tax=Acrobeloides nanus TaxID=290746 RepID=A0A914EFV1_9BILA
MTSKIQLDRDVISRICKHNLAQKLIKGRLDLSDFKLGLVSKKCFLALKTACDEECKAAKDWRFIICSRGFRVQRASYFGKRVEISEPVLWLLNELSSLRELEFDDNNDQRYLQLLRKINGFGLKRIDFGCLLVSDSKFFREFSDSDHRAEMLRIISESSGSGTLKELCYVPDILVPHLPHTLKLEKLTASLRSIPMNSNIKVWLGFI